MQRQKPFNHSIWFLVLVFFTLIGLIMSFYDENLPKELAVFGSFGIWCLCLLVILKSTLLGIFSPVTVYMVLLGVFHLGLIVPEAIGCSIENKTLWLFSPYLPKALALCAVAFSSCAIGAVFASKIAKHYYYQQNCSNKRNALAIGVEFKFLFWGGILIGVVGLIMLLVGLSTLQLFSIDYGESYALRMTKDPRLFGTGFLFGLMGMVISAVGASRYQIKWVCVVSIGMLLPLYLYGFRGYVTVYFISFLLIWNLKDRYFARKVAIVALITIVLLSPAVKAVRESENFSFAESIKTSNLLSFLTEAGGSVQPLIETINEIEFFSTGYWYGRSYVIALVRVIPNLSLNWGGRGTYDIGPSGWITKRVNPWVYARGGGIGYSGVAEPYLNFGPLGVVVYFATLGYLLARYETTTLKRPKSLAILLCACAALFWTTRNDFTNFFRPAIWSWLYISAICFVGHGVMSKKMGFGRYSAISH